MNNKLVGLIGGDADIGTTRIFWIGFIVVTIMFFLYPTQVSEFRASNVAYYLDWVLHYCGDTVAF